MKNFLILLFTIISFIGFSQVSSLYSFSETTGTYTAIVGGTQLVTTTGGAVTYDTDGSYFTIPSASQFQFNNTTITSVNMTADGALFLNPGTTTTGNGVTGPISSTGTATGVIAGMGMDLRSTAIASQVYERRWQDVGTEVVFQWQNVARYLQSGSERFSFQIRINKSNGQIRIVYGNMTTITTSTTYQPMVGLRGSTNTDYNNRRLTNSIPDATPNWGAPNGTTAGTSNAHTVRFTSTGSCVPTSGLIFIWTVQSCVGPTSPTITYTSFSSANLSWTAPASPPSNGYNWELRSSGAGGSGATGLVASGSVAAGTTSATANSLTQQTSYTLYVQSNCGGTLSSWVASTASTSPPTNNDCSNATSVTVNGSSTCTSTTTASSVGATQSSTACSATAGGSDDDVWFSFVATNTSHVITVTPGTMSDVVFQVFGGTCSGLSSLACIDATAGTSVETTTLNSLSVGVTYYMRVHSYSATNGTRGTFTICITTTPTPSCISTPTSPTDGATNQSLTPTLTWPSATYADNYDVYFGTTLPGTPTTNTVSTSYSPGTLLPGTTYYWKIVPKNSVGQPTDCATWSFTTLTPPINDNPSGAITLTIGTTVSYSTYTNLYSTNTTTESTPSCASYAGEDVWFKVVVPQYINSLDFDTQTGNITDGGMAIYRGTIGSLVEIQCDDDSSPNGLMSFISRTDFFEYETIYIRVWEYGGGTTGTFGISVTTPQPLPVELSQFEGVVYPMFNLIKWTTESEQNSNYFDLESSIDGENWRLVVTKTSAGNSNEEIRYSYIDNNLNEIVYYRLQQVDIDGKYKTYGPIVIERNLKSKKIIGYMNILGQIIDPTYATGIIIEIYEDGTLIKKLK